MIRAGIAKGEIPLVDRLNRIEEEHRKGTLAAFVRSNPGYQGLPEASPGFSSDSMAIKPTHSPGKDTSVVVVP